MPPTSTRPPRKHRPSTSVFDSTPVLPTPPNPPSPPSPPEREDALLQPALSTVRAAEFATLEKQRHVYLDYTGAALCPCSLLTTHFRALKTTVCGNPHSSNPTAALSSARIEATRVALHTFFNTRPETHTIVFTANATAAIKLVAESYCFSPAAPLVLLADNHNAVQGIREYARRANTRTVYLPLRRNLRAGHDTASLLRKNAPADGHAALFAYPLQSNFSGVVHSKHLAHVARQYKYDVLLDVAAYTPTHRLDIPATRADFVPVSFYKMFGFPTGVGALIVRRKALPKLRRPWFSGGTVRFVSVREDAHVLDAAPTAFEDGTVNFLGIPAIRHGLRFLNGIGMEAITQHVEAMTELMLNGMLRMQYENGHKAIIVYGPKSMQSRGGTIAFNVCDHNGEKVPPAEVEKAANKRRISLRTGCFCNPGAAEAAGVINRDLAATCLSRRSGTPETDTAGFSNCIGNQPFGAVRVSVGLPTVVGDVTALLDFLEKFIAQR